MIFYISLKATLSHLVDFLEITSCSSIAIAILKLIFSSGWLSILQYGDMIKYKQQ